MIMGRDQRVSRWFWRIETEHHRWSIRLHLLAPGNAWRLNRQPRFAELFIGRCVVLCHSRLGRSDRAYTRGRGAPATPGPPA